MIAVIDVEIQASNPCMPLYPWRAFKNSPSSLRIRNVPKKIGTWNITSVDVQVEYPNNQVLRESAKLVGGVWVCTIDGSNISGRTTNGYTVIASGVDEFGASITDYILGKGDVEILNSNSIIEAGLDANTIKIFNEQPTELNNGDAWFEDDILIVYQNGTLHRLGEGFKPTTAQLDALNSGITESIVTSLQIGVSQSTPLYNFNEIPVELTTVELIPYNIMILNQSQSFNVIIPENETTKARECILVVNNTSSSDISISWADYFHPRTDAKTDFKCVANKTNVYQISEYKQNHFIVTGWQEIDIVDYLHFTAEQDNSSVSLICYGFDESNDWEGGPIDSWCEFEYSMTGNDGDWSDYTTGQIVNLNKDETVYLRAKQGNVEGNPNLNGLAIDYGYTYHQFVMEGSIKADGNIQFLLDKTGTKTDVPENCYSHLFKECTALTKSPELPATTLAFECYSFMFEDCTSLTQAPELPATTLAGSCYMEMFARCFALTQAPELPAPTLADYCYSGMFNQCASLTQAPKLPATTLADMCYYQMFSNCTALTQAPELPAPTLADYCYSYMFFGCTALTQAPLLPATSLMFSCYDSMFDSCSSLNNVNVSFTDWNESESTIYWLSDVKSSGTFTCPSSLPEKRGASYIPNGWTIVRK